MMVTNGTWRDGRDVIGRFDRWCSENIYKSTINVDRLARQNTIGHVHIELSHFEVYGCRRLRAHIRPAPNNVFSPTVVVLVNGGPSSE